MISNISSDGLFIRTAIPQGTALRALLADPSNHHLLPREGSTCRMHGGVLRVFSPRDPNLPEARDIDSVHRELVVVAQAHGGIA